MQRTAALERFRDPRVRFLVVGVASTLVHLTVLSAVLPLVVAEAANAIAFVVAAQVNFAASYWWTWSSRRGPGRETARRLLQRLAMFYGSALVAFGVNSACFTLSHRLLHAPPLVSAVLATAVSALVSFAVTSRIVFRGRAVASVAAASVAAASAVAPVVTTPRVLTGATTA